MRTEEEFIGIVGAVFLITLFGSLFIGAVYGIALGERLAIRNAVNFCVEQPSACKTKYDYYKLENQK